VPERAIVQDFAVAELKKLRDQMWLSKKDEAEAFGLIDEGALVTWDMHMGIVPLSDEKIIKSAGKRKGTRSQAAVMGASAPAVSPFRRD
jgi:hypothetical protein